MHYFWEDWFVPLLSTLGVHAVLIYLVASSAELAPVEIIPTKVPDYIKASLVSPPPAPSVPTKPRVVDTPKPKQERLAAPIAVPEVATYEQAEALNLDAAPQPEAIVTAADVSGLLQAIEAEDDLLQEESDLQTVAKYQTLIKAAIQSKWSRPPSARNGMQAKLRIRLVPSGEVVSVNVMAGSGNDAFDRSAVNAVWLNERFAGLVGMEPRLFEEYFRELNLVFNPEDLLL